MAAGSKARSCCRLSSGWTESTGTRRPPRGRRLQSHRPAAKVALPDNGRTESCRDKNFDGALASISGQSDRRIRRGVGGAGMANIYSAGASRRTIVFAAIIVLHFGFYLALKAGLVRAGMQLVQDLSIMDLPPPPPPPEDMEEPPPPPPVDVPPPLVPPPLIDLPAFEGPSSAITARVEAAPQRAPTSAARPVQITPPRIKAKGDRISAAINACYPSASRRLSEEGRVVVTITIDAIGKAGAMSVSQSSGFARLDGAAECVIRRLPFEPGKRDGQPVEAQATLPIVFKLE